MCGFRFQMSFLMLGQDSQIKFLFTRNVVSSQCCVLCAADSEDWFHVLRVCLTYCNIRNLDDMWVQVVNGICNFIQCLASSNTLQCVNAYAC